MPAASFLHSSCLQVISAVMLWPVHVQKVPQASEHLCAAKLQTRRDICCACQSICPFIPTDNGTVRMSYFWLGNILFWVFSGLAKTFVVCSLTLISLPECELLTREHGDSLGQYLTGFIPCFRDRIAQLVMCWAHCPT